MKAMKLNARWVLVTGASSGLGKEMARVLAHDHRANLVLVARRGERLEELRREIESTTAVKVVCIVADLSRLDEVERVFKEATTGRSLYGAILNAGVTHFGHWDELDWDGFVQMQSVNNTSVAKFTTLLLPYLEREKEQGGLMIVASMAGLTPVAYQAFYSATKGFLVNLGASLHHEMMPRGVSVTTFVPGGVVTEMTDGARFNDLRGWLMPVEPCAKEGVEAFRRRRYVHAPGFVYRWGGALSRLLPQRLFVGAVAAQYRRSLRKNS
jgi:uncharacterized protein